jgi:hypothetical protein
MFYRIMNDVHTVLLLNTAMFRCNVALLRDKSGIPSSKNGLNFNFLSYLIAS